jgi:hypothetical protein
LTGFTAEELKELRRFDAEIDAQPVPWSEIQACEARDRKFASERNLVSPQEKWRKKNLEHKRQNNRDWRQRNHDRQLEMSRAWVEAHKDAVKEYKRQWYQANKERIKERDKARREKNQCARNSAGQSGT